MSNKAADNYPHALEFVSGCYKTQKTCDQAVDTHSSTINLFLNATRLKKCVIKQFIYVFLYFILLLINIKRKKYVTVVSSYPFLIVHCPDKYITQRMCDEAVDYSLAALKLIPDWFVTSKMIRKLYTACHTDNGLIFLDEDFGDLTFCSNEIGLINVNLNNINLDNNFEKNDHIIIPIRLLHWHNKFKKHEVFESKISKELMPIVWHPKILWNFYMQKIREKK